MIIGTLLGLAGRIGVGIIMYEGIVSVGTGVIRFYKEMKDEVSKEIEKEKMKEQEHERIKREQG